MIQVLCGKCNQTVEHLFALGLNPDDDYVFVARCHGEVEITRIPRLLILLGPMALTGGVAFKPEKGVAA